MNTWKGLRNGALFPAAALVLLALVATPASAATVINEIDLEITKTGSAPVVDVGANVIYSLGVVNNGPSTAPTVQVIDVLPAEVAFLAATPFQGTCSHDGSATGGTVTCDLGRMERNVPAPIEITVQLVTRPAASDCFPNSATVADVTGVLVIDDNEVTWPDVNPATNAASTETCTPPRLGSIGDRVWYDLNADGAQDPGEPGIPGVTAALSGDGAGTSDSAGADGFYPLFTGLAPGNYTVDATCPVGFFATTAGSVDVGLAADESFLDADFGCSNIDLALSKFVSATEVGVGEQVVFTVAVTNQGLAPATGVTVSDALPAGLTYVSDNGAGAFDPGSFVWTIGGLAPGASASLEFLVTVTQAGTFTNVAQVATANEPDVDSTPGNDVFEEDDQDDATVVAAQVAATCTVGNFVWLDSDRDGQQDAGEAGIGGVTVNITNSGTNATSSTTTDANGLYLFAGLDAGTYRIDVVSGTAPINLALTTVGTFTVSLDGFAPCEFLDADFGFGEVLPVTGMNVAEAGAWALALLLVGGFAVVATRRRSDR